MSEDSSIGASGHRSVWLWRSLTLLIVSASAVLLAGRAMDRGLNHDEHQFLAPAALLASGLAEPYRDYPIFHLPNLVIAYAGAEWLRAT